MTYILLIVPIIIFTCIFLNRFSTKIGIPVLLLFIFFGLLYGMNVGELNLTQYEFVENTCTVALIFIMFYGGFGTRWHSAKPVALEAGLLATLGVFLTAGLTGLFCHYGLKWNWLESLLMGSVISSTDAATVFAILRGKKLGLKHNTAPMLEIESGSNDPCSYMLTALMLSLVEGTAKGNLALNVAWTVFSQIAFGAACGALIAMGALWILRKFNLTGGGYDMLFFFAIAIFAYAIPNAIGGNGFLSTYIVGIILGNNEFSGRKQLVPFFDGVTSLMQILIFFLLGFMCVPGKLLKAIVPAVMIFLFISIVARTVAVSAILVPFRKYKANQIGLISFVGLRGAASIVFAIMTLSHGVTLENDIFSVVFCIVLISIALQGSLIPFAAKKFKMIDERNDVMKTFTDYSENAELSFGQIEVTADSSWNGKMVKDLHMPGNVLLPMLFRDKQRIVPKGNTVFHEGDIVIVCSKLFEDKTQQNLIEHEIRATSKWIGHKVKEYPYQEHQLLVMIRRGDEDIIPNGNTEIKLGDILIILKLEDQ